MEEPTWILETAVYVIHRRQLDEHGGKEGILNPDMLSSALARARNIFAYSNPKPDLATLAAAYAVGINRNHAFADGNKRTAYVVCRTFLILNGYDIDATADEKYATFLAVAEGTMGDDELAAWIRCKLIASSPG